MERVGGDGPEALHGAGRVDADEFEFLADVAMTFFAGGALTAGIERADGDAVAFLPGGNFVANGFDDGAAFVADDLGEGDAMIHVAVK